MGSSGSPTSTSGTTAGSTGVTCNASMIATWVDLVNCTSVVGSVVLAGPATGPNMTLPLLRSMTGSLEVQGGGTLSMPVLVAVGGALSVSGLQALAVPMLATVGGSVTVQGTTAAALSLPSLTAVGGSLAVDYNGNLTSLAVPQLAVVGGSVAVVSNPQLVLDGSFAAGGLAVNGTVNVTGVAAVDVQQAAALNLSCTSACGTLTTTAACAGYATRNSSGCGNPVGCPGNSTGATVVAGCTCNAGYVGNITASLMTPFYAGVCAGIH